jgi:hypothetical protein
MLRGLRLPGGGSISGENKKYATAFRPTIYPNKIGTVRAQWQDEENNASVNIF